MKKYFIMLLFIFSIQTAYSQTSFSNKERLSVFNNITNGLRLVCVSSRTQNTKNPYFTLHYIYPQSVSFIDQNTFQAWELTVSVFPYGKSSLYKSNYVVYEKILAGYKVSTKQNRFINAVTYNDHGDIILTNNNEDFEWQYLLPNSIGEEILLSFFDTEEYYQKSYKHDKRYEDLAKRAIQGLERNGRWTKLFKK